MKRLYLFSVMSVLFAAGSGTAQDVRYNFDGETSFQNFKTYKWVQFKDAAKVNDILDSQIRAALDAELSTKGLTKVEADNADLYIGYQAAVLEDKQFTSYSSNWGYGPGWGRGWYGGGGMGTTQGQTTTIYVGQLVVDMYDSAKQNLVWRGLVSKTLDPKAKPDKQQKNLQKAVQKLLKNYPPPVKK